jgi:hypothetical protein
VARVIAVAPHGPATAQHAVDRLRDANGQSLTATRQAARLVGLDEQVDVVRLNAELQYPKAPVAGRGEGAADGVEHPTTTQ